MFSPSQFYQYLLYSFLSILYLFSFLYSHFCIIILYLVLSLYFLSSQFLLILCFWFCILCFAGVFSSLVLFSSCILNWFSVSSLASLSLYIFLFLCSLLIWPVIHSTIFCSIELFGPYSTPLTSTLHWNCNNMTWIQIIITCTRRPILMCHTF